MQAEDLTKKEQIINFARHDPFLKISDIAERVETTPRYVRTILSEANISLMELREKYARNMEQRLSGREADLQKATIQLLRQDGEVAASDVKLQQIDDFEFDELVQTDEEEELYKIVQVRMIDNEAYGLQEVITYLSSDINQDRICNLDSLYELFGNKGVNNLKFKNNIIQVEEANAFLADKLDIDRESPIVKSQRIMLIDKLPIGIENYYFDADSVQLVLPGELVV
ncbi:UTRA domain-containing protein [Halanaerobaculum tunisiense]